MNMADYSQAKQEYDAMNYPRLPEPQDVINPHEQPDTEGGAKLEDQFGDSLETLKKDLMFDPEYYVMGAMEVVNNIKGVEFESFQDWMAHVEVVLSRIKQG